MFLYTYLAGIGQWYPGHIAKTEKELKEQLKLMDVVIEVRDARIPMSTSHPQVSFFYLLVGVICMLQFTQGCLGHKWMFYIIVGFLFTSLSKNLCLLEG